MRKFYLLLIIVLISQSIFSQRTTSKDFFSITGKVTDESGVAINAVSIKIKGKAFGTFTNQLGEFNLANVSEGDSIFFTHIAYQPTKIFIQGNNLINAELKRNTYHFADFKITDTTQKSLKRKQEKDEDRIFQKVEVMPSYKGGRIAMSDYFKKVIKYPESAKKRNIEGVVVIGFVVDRDNKIKEVKVVKGISQDCDDAAVKAIKNMTDWICGIQNGRGVDVYIEISITFSLVTLTTS